MNGYFVLWLSFRFNEIQAKANLIWKYQQIELINEYMDSYAFPPPLNLIAYLKLAYNKFIKKDVYSTEKRYLESVRAEKFDFLTLETKCAIQLYEKERSANETDQRMKDVAKMKEYFSDVNMKLDQMSSWMMLRSSNGDEKISGSGSVELKLMQEMAKENRLLRNDLKEMLRNDLEEILEKNFKEGKFNKKV